MDKRLKRTLPENPLQEQEELFGAVRSGGLGLSEAVRRMRRLSRLTQPEFAKHRGISVQSLRQIETGTGNPTVETLNKIASIFGLEVGFVVRRPSDKGG